MEQMFRDCRSKWLSLSACFIEQICAILTLSLFLSLSLCDLAGSERCNKTKTFGERLKEAGNINNSLLILGKCIAALRNIQNDRYKQMPRVQQTSFSNVDIMHSELNSVPVRSCYPLRTKTNYIPFRESKLTRLFQGMFCGRGRASMIVNINQCASTYDETLHVMKFSAVAKQVCDDRLQILRSFAY